MPFTVSHTDNHYATSMFDNNAQCHQFTHHLRTFLFPMSSMMLVF